MFSQKGARRVQSSRGMTVYTVEFITNRCRELWAFRGSFVEEVVRELSLEGQAGFGRGMGEGRRHRQRETLKLCSWPRSGRAQDLAWSPKETPRAGR